MRRSQRARRWQLEVPWGEPARLTAPRSMSWSDVERVLRDSGPGSMRKPTPGATGWAWSGSRSASRRRASATDSSSRPPPRTRPSSSASPTSGSGSETSARPGAPAPPAARSPSTGGSCWRPSRSSTTWSCTSSATCAASTTRGASGRSSKGAAHSGASSASGCASTGLNCSPSKRPTDARTHPTTWLTRYRLPALIRACGRAVRIDNHPDLVLE